MFTRRVLYHPYKRSTIPSPAGFRIADYIPRRCFNLFQGPDRNNIRTPDSSPASSPVRGSGQREDGSPPTFRVADLFTPNGNDDGIDSPQRQSTPVADPLQDAPPAPHTSAGPKTQIPVPPPRRTRRGPKHLSFTHGTAPRRRAYAPKLKRETSRKRGFERYERRMLRARASLGRLRREAETLMKPRHMNKEDRIFMEQLRAMQYDQQLTHDLEEYRQRMVRAAEEAPKRIQEQEERDREVAMMWGARCEDETLEEEVQEEQRKKLAAFMRTIEEKREACNRKREDAAMLRDLERQRAHELRERVLREEQERFFRDELARKAKEEEEERKMREEEARLMQEEQDRRAQQERDRRARGEKERQLREIRERRLRMERERREQEERERKTQGDIDRKLLEEIRRLRKEAHERTIREDKDRQRREEAERFRREAHERFARETRERLRREAYERESREERERLAREEREHQARNMAEEAQARRTAEEEQLHQCFVVYDGKWNELRTSNNLPPIDAGEMPWPVFDVVSSADQITSEVVKEFLFHPQRPGVEGKTARDKVKSEVLRFHPDKFNAHILPKIQSSHRKLAQEIAGAVARILTGIMTEEVEQQQQNV